MKNFNSYLAVGLSLNIMANSAGRVFAEETKTPTVGVSIPSSGVTVDGSFNIKPSEEEKPPTNKCPQIYQKPSSSLQTVRLYYLRNATAIKGILDTIAEANCMTEMIIQAQDSNTIILYGTKDHKEELHRIIATLDLPRERVNLDMWGIVISGDNPREMANVMREVNQEIAQTQRLLRETYRKLVEFSRAEEDDDTDLKYKELLEETLGYTTALDAGRPSLSMTDILLRINAAKEPVDNYNEVAKELCELFQGTDYQDYITSLQKNAKKGKIPIPFENFLRLGLLQGNLPSPQPAKNDQSQPSCEGNIKDQKSVQSAKLENLTRRRAVLDFALQYANLRNNPNDFDPQSLQQSAESLNTLLDPLVEAINQDVSDLFIQPTLERIQAIVRKYRHVQYAEVGKTRVATLNGSKSTVASKSVSTFEGNPPLRLNELLQEVNAVSANTEGVVPDIPITVGAQTIPAKLLVDVVAALSKDTSTWRELTSGISLDVTPSVLYNSASAELEIDFTIGPKDVTAEIERNSGENARKLSRINQNTVQTKVYVNTLDIFALSTFNSQTTVDGGRGYVPIIGPVWKGIFSSIPIFGELFSWRNPPQNVQHQSILLTNSFIVPTALGLVPLYPPQQEKHNDKEWFYERCRAVEEYKFNRKQEIEQDSPESESQSLGLTYYSSQPSELVKRIEAICGSKPSINQIVK